MSKLYLYNYNNYFNRIIKRESTLADYGTPLYTLSNCNFNYNDGVSASHDINFDSQEGDYVIITDDNNNIVSRWYVTENKRLRGGQHNLRLRRDLIADNYNKIIKAPMLINRAMINDPDNPLLFNSEGFSFNQIKNSESLLKDRSGSAWYALYFSKNAPHKTGTINAGNLNYDTEISTTIESSDYADGEFTYYSPENIDFRGIANAQNLFVDGFKHLILFPNGNQRTVRLNYSSYVTSEYTQFTDNLTQVHYKLVDAFSNQYNTLCNKIKLYGDIDDNRKTVLDKIGNNNSIYVLDSDSNVYKVTVNIKTEYIDFKSETTGDFVTSMKALITSSGLNRTGEWGTKSFGYSCTKYTYTVYTELQTSDVINWSLFDSGKTSTKDADYNVILIPYNDITASYTIDETYSNNGIKAEHSRALIESIIKEYGSTQYLYDVQLLPYFPYQQICDIHYPGNLGNLIFLEANEEYTGGVGLNANQYYATENEADNIIIIYATSCKFSIDINYNVSVPNYDTNPAINKKIINETHLLRLCSPNYNGLFEISLAKNNGIENFNVDVTMRPYNPYIHVNPNFKSLYGSDFDDARGLICQGDFSLPIVTDAFKQYEYQNKNYLNVFNRQIEHMDFEHQKAQQEALFGAITGTMSAGIGGAVAGSVVGGPGGAIAGAAIGTITSAIGGAVDYNILKQRQAENKDLTIDMFNYQLGNIKALAYSINKVTPYTNNNKIWPFIEIYTSTSIERDILKNKIKYNSMRIEAIGKMEDYIQEEKTYISGSLIRLQDFDMPTHELNEIYDELVKGVYI